MRILFLAMDAFGGMGGIAKYNRDFLRALGAAPGVSEVVAVPRRMPLPPETLPPNLTYITEALSGRTAYITALVKLVQKAKFDLIYCGHLKLLPMAFCAKLVTRAPLLLIIYGIDAWTPAYSHLTRFFLSRVDVVISISDITRQRFREWSHATREKFVILPNAIIQSDYSVGPKNPTLLQRYGLGGKTVLLTVGRLASGEKYKGFDEILELLPALSREIPTIAYLIVGDGDDRPRLAAKARTLGVEDRVIFTGFVPETEMADHYCLADVFVMPGQGEGFGYVFLEALACGIPVVGSILDGSREALRSGALGVLVDPRRPDDILAGIRQALQQPRGVIPAGLEYFSFENFQKRCHGILGQVMASGKTG